MSLVALEKAILIAESRALLARRVGVKPQAVTQWLLDGRVPAKRVIDVSRAAYFRVTPHELRSDIYPYPNDGLPLELRTREI